MRTLELDQVFEKLSNGSRFVISNSFSVFGSQSPHRYKLGGSPLPFTSDKVSDLHRPKPPSDTPPTTKSDLRVIRPSWRTYDATQVPQCPSCNASRVLECQLMPNLINVLSSHMGRGVRRENENNDKRRADEARNLSKKTRSIRMRSADLFDLQL